MPGEPASGVKKFFESYRMAFERLDAPAIADHFAFPLHITGDTDEIQPISVMTKQDWIDNVERLLDMYRRIGFASARFFDLTAAELSPRLIQTNLHWELYDGEAHLLYQFQAAYTLAKINDTLRITAIAHNEIPRYREALAKRQL